MAALSKEASSIVQLDIKKAFDSVQWDYIIDLHQRRGFPSRFRNWVNALLSTATSRVLLNRVPARPDQAWEGFEAGGPLSPLRFILTIDPLQNILASATDHGILHRLPGKGTAFRTSPYADDVTVFVAPFCEDIDALAHILNGFGEVTSLKVNF